jgi:multidrug resistance efflux pump
MTEENRNANAVQLVGTLHQLVLESIQAATRQELVFRMLNRTVGLCKYDRALFFKAASKSLKLFGISGQSDVNSTSEKTAQWLKLASNLNESERLHILTKDDFPEEVQNDWEAYSRECSNTTVIWIPLKAWGEHVGGLWLERWSDIPWTEGDERILASLGIGYGGAWERMHPPKPWLDMFQRIAKKKRSAATVIILTMLLLFLRLPLRVVAPCEVVAEKPFVVTAPLHGVVEGIKVSPGDSVSEGQVLFVYNKQVIQQELDVAHEQVEIIKSNLDRVRMQAFVDPRARSEISILEHRLKQEMARFELAQYNASRLEVTAGISGVAVLSNPEKWRGRPVAVGERVLSIVKPGNTKIKVWVPEDDNIVFNPDHPAKVLLNVFPETDMAASITYVGGEVIPSPQRIQCVEVEAKWIDHDPRVKIGLKGVSVLYGKKVMLLYWLFRKPWATINGFF